MTFRVPGPHERGRFAPEAWGHLLALRGSGLLSASDFEQLIDRVLGQVEGRVALENERQQSAPPQKKRRRNGRRRRVRRPRPKTCASLRPRRTASPRRQEARW